MLPTKLFSLQTSLCLSKFVVAQFSTLRQYFIYLHLSRAHKQTESGFWTVFEKMIIRELDTVIWPEYRTCPVFGSSLFIYTGT